MNFILLKYIVKLIFILKLYPLNNDGCRSKHYRYVYETSYYDHDHGNTEDCHGCSYRNTFLIFQIGSWLWGYDWWIFRFTSHEIIYFRIKAIGLYVAPYDATYHIMVKHKQAKPWTQHTSPWTMNSWISKMLSKLEYVSNVVCDWFFFLNIFIVMLGCHSFPDKYQFSRHTINRINNK